MKLRIVGDGTRKGTRIENADTGEALEGVMAASWELRPEAGQFDATVTLRLARVHVDVVGWCYDVHGIPTSPKDKSA